MPRGGTRTDEVGVRGRAIYSLRPTRALVRPGTPPAHSKHSSAVSCEDAHDRRVQWPRAGGARASHSALGVARACGGPASEPNQPTRTSLPRLAARRGRATAVLTALASPPGQFACISPVFWLRTQQNGRCMHRCRPQTVPPTRQALGSSLTAGWAADKRATDRLEAPGEVCDRFSIK